MNKRKVIAVTAVALSVLSAASAVTALGVMYRRVKAFDVRNHCDVLAGLSAAQLKAKAMQAECADRPSPAEDANKAAREAKSDDGRPVVLAVDRVGYDGDTALNVFFNERPDMDAVRRYVSVTPLREGTVGLRYQTSYSWRLERHEPVLRVTGDFAYRTNCTLRILKGMPLYGKGANPSAEGALAADFTYSFRRHDPPPSVKFADDGRYLPPGGRKTVRIESIGVTNVATSICRVEPRNIVQLLARDEGVYNRCSWRPSADEEDTRELSGACVTGLVRCVNRPCESETNPFAVAPDDGGPDCGVFLLSVRNADRPWNNRSWDECAYKPDRYRLVCLSDLGLSVRAQADGLGVWVTSLMTGKPVSEAHVEVYSSANILVAEGESDARGWCVPTRRSSGEPFAVVVRTAEDMTFLALRKSMTVDETYADGARPEYLDGTAVDAFVWTERGIYRHDERIFVHALVRDGDLAAPRPMPLVLELRNPRGEPFASKTLVTDSDGALAHDGFSVPAEQPSGKWKLLVRLPGKDGAALAEKEVKVEEFAPPQIRVAVAADAAQHPSDFTFRISAEHLFGGPAQSLMCEGAVVFEDVPFAPAQWKGFAFGDEGRGLKPCFRRLAQQALDDAGACVCAAPLWADAGRPKAAVRATGQGVVFEDGGRPATARTSVLCHYYPFYIGSTLPEWVKLPETGFPKVDLVCVDPTGALVQKPRKLVGRIERIDSVYAYRMGDCGRSTWDCERVRTTVLADVPIPVGDSGRASYALPIRESGDYVFTVEDPESGVSFGRTFYLSDWGDDVVRAPLGDPTDVTILTDKAFYRVGERPRLVVKAPFAGYALLSVLRQGLVYEEVLNLTNATSVVELRPIARDWAPNVDVTLSVVQSVTANVRHLAARAHGMATVRVRPIENESAVKVEVEGEEVKGEGDGEGGSRLVVSVEAPGATSAVVTLVDEGINLLTDEPTPNPVGWLARPRTEWHPLYDLYGRILPVADDGLGKSGVKTGGGFGAEMLGRVSPVPTRRFKPLARWQAKVAITDGKGRAVFDLPEFVGEVRVTALACSPTATGAASVRRKVAPKLVMQPDAPRFVAPEDVFEVTMPLRNCSGEAGVVRYAITCDGCDEPLLSGRVALAKDGATNVVGRCTAPNVPGEMSVGFRCAGLGESHRAILRIPVRPAVASRQQADVLALRPREKRDLVAETDGAQFCLSLSGMPFAGLAHALEWLADYPHGCL